MAPESSNHIHMIKQEKVMATKEQEDRERRERAAVQKAQQERKGFSYIDTDGCEVTVTSAGHVFYHPADWW
jgi:hypothetical protein